MAEDKPVVESFQLDHTKVKAPYVRYIDTQTGPNGDVISNYDLRLVQPNENAIPTGGLHTIEHTPPSNGFVHPGTAALGVAGIRVQVKLAD